MTHIQLVAANEDLLVGALRTAWKLRLEKNSKSGQINLLPRGSYPDCKDPAQEAVRVPCILVLQNVLVVRKRVREE